MHRFALARRAAVAVLIAVGLVVTGSVVQPGTAATPTPTSTKAIDTVLQQTASVVADPGFAAFAKAAPALDAVTNRFATDTGDLGVDRVAKRFNAVLASSAYGQAVEDLTARFPSLNSSRGIPEAIAHINRGNGFVLAAVGVFTVLVIPGILNCPIGQAANCVPFWLLVGAGLAAGALVNAGFEYVAAVLALAE